MNWIRGLGVGLMVVGMALPILAQEQPPGGPIEPAGRGGPPDDPAGRGGPEADRGGPDRGGPGRGGPQGEPAGPLMEIRNALGAGDEEWNVLLPKIQAVQAAKKDVEHAARGGRGPGRGGPDRGGPDRGGPDRGGPDGGGADRGNAGSDAASVATPTPLQAAQSTLQTVLANSDATVEEYKSAMAALRAARRKSADNLTKAQNELIRLLTVRQEAVLLQLGIL
jgi:hypothetical protein